MTQLRDYIPHPSRFESPAASPAPETSASEPAPPTSDEDQASEPDSSQENSGDSRVEPAQDPGA